MKRIAYQGVKGAFSYMTALKEFGKENHYIGLQTFKEVFEMLECGQSDYAVIPIENSLIGSIYENDDLLNAYEMQIIGEQFTKIEHCLLTVPNSQEQEEKSLMLIRKVLSHPKALDQCSHFFQKHPWIEAIVYLDTAAAAAEIASHGDPTRAAIASASAGELYGLQILKKGIEDDPKNYTRFVTVTKNERCSDQINKCSLLLQLKHVPGALAEMLKQFAAQAINLTKIESRPIRGRPFEYLFYVDFEFIGRKRKDIEDLLNMLYSSVQKIKILGFYKKGTLWTV